MQLRLHVMPLRPKTVLSQIAASLYSAEACRMQTGEWAEYAVLVLCRKLGVSVHSTPKAGSLS